MGGASEIARGAQAVTIALLVINALVAALSLAFAWHTFNGTKRAAFDARWKALNALNGPATVVLAAPKANDLPAVWDLVVADMHARDVFGAIKYGQRLKPHDGRDALYDLYQEQLDSSCYIRKLIFERDGR
jgi:hypothetical protein